MVHRHGTNSFTKAELIQKYGKRFMAVPKKVKLPARVDEWMRLRDESRRRLGWRKGLLPKRLLSGNQEREAKQQDGDPEGNAGSDARDERENERDDDERKRDGESHSAP